MLGSATFVAEWEAGRTIAIEGPPFSLAYIVGRENEAGIVAHGRHELFHMLAESLYLDVMPGPLSRAIRAPLITIIGLEVPRLLAGAMVTEAVFAWPGLGRLLTQSLLGRDYPVAMGVLMMLAAAVVLANVLTDLAYRWVDPRVRTP